MGIAMKEKELKGAVFLITVLCLCLFTGCGKEELLDPENPVRIEVWDYYSGYQLVALNEMIDEFNQTIGLQQGIIVENVAQGSIDALTEALFAAMEAEEGLPDVVCIYPDTAVGLEEKELLVPVEDYFSEEELAEFVPGFLEAGRLSGDGEIKLIPVSKSIELLMYNQTDFNRFAEETGVKEQDMSTMEGMVEVAASYYEWTDSLTPNKAEDGKAFFGRDSLENYIIMGAHQLGHPVMETSDGSVWKPDKETFRTLWDNYYIPYINGYFAAYGKFRSDDAKTGRIIAAVCSSSAVSYFPKKITLKSDMSYQIETGMCSAPVFRDGTKEALLQGAGYGIIRSDKSKQYAAAEFLKWLTDKEQNMEFSIQANYMPVTKQALTREALEDYYQRNDVDESIKQSLEIGSSLIEEDRLWAGKPSEYYGEVRYYLADALKIRAEEDRNMVLQYISLGMSREEAVKEFTTDEYFDLWFETLVEGIDEILGR